jgi:hypothetical protein
MAMEFDRDFDGYLDADYGHGIQLTYTPSGGSASSIKGILDQEYIDIDTGGMPIQGFEPIAYVKTTDIPNIAFGDTLAAPIIANLDGTTIKAATTYKVVNFEHDNLGITKLILEEQ